MWRFQKLFFLFSVAALIACSKEDGGSNNNPPVKTRPTVSTSAVTGIAQTTATSGGVVSSDGGAAVVSRGICWAQDPNPTVSDSRTVNGTGKGAYTANLTGLTANSTYYVRAYATNSEGTAYGSEQVFTTLDVPCTTVTDIDGNVYCTVTIGSQTWMTENLKVTHYKNGDPINEYLNSTDWHYTTSGTYFLFNIDVYGAYYNWYAVNDSRGLAPAGWHVATKDDYNALYSYLGGTSYVANMLKANFGWATNGSNSSKFTALPGGYMDDFANLYDQGSHGYWWTSSLYTTPTQSRGIRFLLADDNTMQLADRDKHFGMPVRCVKN